MINEQVLKGKWTELRGKVKEKWGALTDDDLMLAEGNFDQLVGIIQRRSGESREKIEHDLDRLTSEFGSKMENFRQQAASAAATASETVKHMGDRASEAARDYADRAGDSARQQYEQFHQHYEQVAAGVQAKVSEADACIRRNPMEAVLVAFGTGLIAGVVVGLAFRSSRE